MHSTGLVTTGLVAVPIKSGILRRHTAQPSKFLSSRLSLQGTSSNTGLQTVNPVSILFLTLKPSTHFKQSYLKGAKSVTNWQAPHLGIKLAQSVALGCRSYGLQAKVCGSNWVTASFGLLHFKQTFLVKSHSAHPGIQGLTHVFVSNL